MSTGGDQRRIGWIDAHGGISGDMLLGACVDAGVPLEVIEAAVAALGLADQVRLRVEPARRHGFRAVRAMVDCAPTSTPRHLAEICALINNAALSERVAASAIAVFERLAAAEGHVHGVDPDEVHFHEVGALDSLVDIVGTVAAFDHLDLARIVLGPISLGGGTVATQHGTIAVPGPAVLALLSAAPAVASGGPIPRELATPTGIALALTLATDVGAMPAMVIGQLGIGAGSADPPDHANVCRLVVGRPVEVAGEPAGVPGGAGGVSTASGVEATGSADESISAEPKSAAMVVLETNIDDLDPRLWPGVLQALLDAGAADAWLTPIVMKAGRPAHTLHALSEPRAVAGVRAAMWRHTSTLGVRSYAVERTALPRDRVEVSVDGQVIGVKRGWLSGRIVTAEPEFADVAAAARALGRAEREVLAQARSLAGGADA